MSKKILQILDVSTWAIEELCKPVRQFNQHFEWRVHYLHPKGLERGEIDLTELKKDIEWCDMIDANYWRTLSQLSVMVPEIKEKKILLTHHNEKNLFTEDWSYVDHFIGATQFNYNQLAEKYGESKLTLVPNSFDENVFKYNDEYPPAKPCVGYVGRVVPWKGLKEVAKACFELGYTLKFMGKIDKPSYFAEIPDEHQENIDFEYMECQPEDRPDFYKTLTCYVGYSGSGREIGPLGLIQAMATGVPVITTPQGIAKDICEDMENSLIVDFNDYDQLKHQLQNLMESPQLQKRLRNAGWNTIRNFNDERRALKYRKVLNKMLYTDKLVSVIIPATYKRYEQVETILNALQGQTYKNFEVVVVWDEAKENAPPMKQMDYVVKYLWTNKTFGYNLAMARNLGVSEASGKYLVFLDSRLQPKQDAIENFVIRLKKLDKAWYFGDKGSQKKNFVENFSGILREHFIEAGMMNEMITGYGGLSQELRERFTAQGFELKYCDEIKATQLMTARKSQERRQQIIKMKNLLYKLYE
jgi:glycosyltransferase involved in cell wall biosynthesis